MDITGVIAVVLIFGTGFMAVAGVLLIAIIKTLRGKPGGGKLDTQEAQLIQDIHHGLSKMEGRVEALETILLEMQRKEQ